MKLFVNKLFLHRRLISCITLYNATNFLEWYDDMNVKIIMTHKMTCRLMANDTHTQCLSFRTFRLNQTLLDLDFFSTSSVWLLVLRFSTYLLVLGCWAWFLSWLTVNVWPVIHFLENEQHKTYEHNFEPRDRNRIVFKWIDTQLAIHLL